MKKAERGWGIFSIILGIVLGLAGFIIFKVTGVVGWLGLIVIALPILTLGIILVTEDLENLHLFPQ